jgi:hypothetical protein
VLLAEGDDYLATLVDIFEKRAAAARAATRTASRTTGKRKGR